MLKMTAIKNFSLKRNKVKKVAVSQRIKKSEEVFEALLVVLIIFMSSIYIYQMSSIATHGYEVEKYEDRRASLKKENQKIIIKLADLKTMHNFENYNNELVAVECDNISYITSSSSAVAIRR